MKSGTEPFTVGRGLTLKCLPVRSCKVRCERRGEASAIILDVRIAAKERDDVKPQVSRLSDAEVKQIVLNSGAIIAIGPGVVC